MSEIYFRFFLKKHLISNYRLTLFIGIYIYLSINKEIIESPKLLTDEMRCCEWVFSSMIFCFRQEFVIDRHHFDRKIFYFINIGSSTITQCDHLNLFSQKTKCIHDFLLSTTSFAKISYLDY